MEVFLIIVGWIVFRMIWSAMFSGSSEPSIGPLEVRVIDDTVGDEKLPIWAVQVKGLIPVQSARNVGATISMFDSTDENPEPVIGAIDTFQEPGGYAFFFAQELGQCLPMHGFVDWATVGLVPKDLVMFPISGRRELSICLRLVDPGNPPVFQHGFVDNNHPGIIAQRVHKLIHQVANGYSEKSEEELSVAAASIRLAVRLALSDGHFDHNEGIAIRDWTKIYVDSIAGEEGRAKAKEFLNEAIKWAIKDGDTGISISDQIAIINQHGGKPEKYAAMELCLDVMAADGKADKGEIDVLGKLCDAFQLDMKSFQDMKDKRMINLEHSSFSSDDVWGKLDIDDGLPANEKKRVLKSLYAKWNSRAESLEDGSEREKAQQMLELIAQARHQLS